MKEKKIPRGLRNNNPLNIRYSKANRWMGRCNHKKDEAFEEFIHIQYGYRAAFIIIHKYITVYHLNTIFMLCARWAPVGDGNNPAVYARTVASRMGCGISQELNFANPQQMVSLAKAMTFVECGQEVNEVEVWQGYRLAADYFKMRTACDESLEEINKLLQRV